MSTDVSKTTALALQDLTDDYTTIQWLLISTTVSDKPGGMCTIPGGGWRGAKESFLEDCSQTGLQKISRNVPGEEKRSSSCKNTRFKKSLGREDWHWGFIGCGWKRRMQEKQRERTAEVSVLMNSSALQGPGLWRDTKIVILCTLLGYHHSSHRRKFSINESGINWRVRFLGLQFQKVDQPGVVVQPVITVLGKLRYGGSEVQGQSWLTKSLRLTVCVIVERGVT